MDGSAAVTPDRRKLARHPATGILVVGLVACTALAVAQASIDHAGHNSLSVVLAIAAVAAGIAVVPTLGRASISAAFVVLLLAVAFLGPASACVCAALSELTAARRLRTPRYAVAFNLLASLVPTLIAGNLVRWLAPTVSNTPRFYLVIALAGVVLLALNFPIVAVYQRVFRGDRSLTLGVFLEYGPSQAINIVLAVAGASIYLKVGVGGITFALTALFAFSYMAHLLEQSRNRLQKYVALSWGVLGGLVRSLDIRDQRAARHAAAVARFASDIARAVGMSEEQGELAHTAGLLHDIGHFALSDRVAERGRTLTDEDWVAIHRHPELGADLLKDLGMYGPVAEIVLAHHERIDGRGYPRGLSKEEIPEIAKIIAVAEVYDTLTARDTYRTRMSSFEALRELRRVVDTQLDGRYVEALAQLLSGEGVEYRHADAADFDAELDMERRIKEAGAGG
jgi:putative nucleotidyltransferase with HDIG domain